MIGRVIGRGLSQFCKSTPATKLHRGFAAQNFDNIKLQHFSQVNTFDNSEIMNALIGATTFREVADILKVGHAAISDLNFAYAMEKLAKFNVTPDDSLNEVIVPYATSFMKKCTTNQSMSFAFVATALGDIGVKDDAFWGAVKHKLLNERFTRYIPLQSLGPLTRAMAHVGQADAQVLKALGGQVLKHQKAIPEKHRNAAIHGFETAGIGADAFRNALEKADDHHELVKRADTPKQLH